MPQMRGRIEKEIPSLASHRTSKCLSEADVTNLSKGHTLSVAKERHAEHCDTCRATRDAIVHGDKPHYVH